MEKREVLNMASSNISKLDVSKGENLTELYVQDNRIEEIDISANRKIEILDCSDNPLRYVRGFAPGGGDMDSLAVEAGKGGRIGLKYHPEEGQTYFAYPDEGWQFEGWYNVLGDRISKDAVLKDRYGTAREIFAMFKR